MNTNLLFANPFPEGRAIAIYNQSAQLVRADDLSVVPPSEARTRLLGGWLVSLPFHWVKCSLLSCPCTLLKARVFPLGAHFFMS